MRGSDWVFRCRLYWRECHLSFQAYDDELTTTTTTTTTKPPLHARSIYSIVKALDWKNAHPVEAAI